MSRRPFRSPPARRGTIVPLLAICTIALFAFIALAVDVGLLMVARSECQNAADTAALTGARVLDDAPTTATGYENNRDMALARARGAVTENVNLNTPFVDDQTPGGRTNIDLARIGLYDYNTSTGRFKTDFVTATRPPGKSWSACEMIVRTNQDTFFARVLGITSMPVGARAVAVHRPRDIALILDLSGSMANGSKFNWGGGMTSTDPLYPKFGHYSRFEVGGYKPYTDALSTTDNNPANRPHPFFQTDGYRTATNFTPPNNYTAPTRNGPAIVHDYFTDPVNALNPSAAAFPLTVSGSTPNLVKAFHNWNPALQSSGDPENYIAPTYTYAGYNAFDTTGQFGPLPAPDNFATQTDVSGIPYVGDKWPRKYGYAANPTIADDWRVTNANGSAITAYEYLGWSAKYTGGTSLPNNATPPNRGAATGGLRTIHSATYPTNPDTTVTPSVVHTGYATDWSNFRDATWEQHGYDLDVADYVTRFVGGSPTHDARVALAAGTTATTVRVTPNKFLGYSMGPGYWGKTFFMWPPDPRTPVSDPGVGGYAPGDWRKRYFTSAAANLNNTLLTDATGQTMRSNAPVNYTAVLRWLKAPPRTVPSNLRAGRVLYYSSIPDNVSSYTTDADQRFWKEYIDYVLAVGSYGGSAFLADPEGMGWPENGTSRVTPDIFNGTLTGYDRDGAGTKFTADAVAYMNYRDNPSRPRLNFWFGPQSMLSFISLGTNPVGAANWSAATTHEAQSWQLKAGIGSALSDIRTNHPNDYVGMCFFSADTSGGTSQSKPMYSLPASPMAQRYSHVKNALFYPASLLTAITDSSNVQGEVRPYTNGWADDARGEIPNANGGTDPNSGFAQAYNLLSPSNSNPNRDSNAARRGRRGATKIVVFETDGVPNCASVTTYNQQGYNSYYTFQSSLPSLTFYSDGSPSAINPALTIVDEIVAPASSSASSGKSGFSLPNSQARVYAIGYGDLFDDAVNPTFVNLSKDFLLNVQKRGKSSPATAGSIPAAQIITGPYQTRIDNLRLALERILQGGVQVTLIE